MKLITFSLLIFGINFYSSISPADVTQQTSYVGWDSLPKELKDIIIYDIGAPKDNALQPEAYTACHDLCATLQRLTLTRKNDKWSKDMANWIKERFIQLQDPVLMSLCGCDNTTIYRCLNDNKQRSLFDQNPARTADALDHLINLLHLEQPLAPRTVLRFIKDSHRILLTNDPLALVPHLAFVTNHYLPVMNTLIKKKEYDILSFLISHKWPLIIGDMLRPDHVKLLVENCSNRLELRKVRDIVHKAYRYNIYFTGTSTYWTRLHSPKSEACSIL